MAGHSEEGSWEKKRKKIFKLGSGGFAQAVFMVSKLVKNSISIE